MTDGRAVASLRDATCSDGAPSARNLLVTVFGDALLPHGDGTAASVASLAALLASFGVNERLVRTSLTRLVNDDLLTTHNVGRRSFYSVKPDAIELFRQADDRIYRSADTDWDGIWTFVVIDGSESTAGQRQRLRQELSWAGFGVVAPNVLASPVASAEAAAAVARHVGGFEHLVITRSTVFESDGVSSGSALAERSAPLAEIAGRYREFVERFERFDASTAGGLEPEISFKLRTMLIASFRRIVLADPMLPASLLPPDWAGRRARAVAAALYAAVADASERYLCEVIEPAITDGPGPRCRFA